jgi:hypothetical protein
MSEDNVRYYEQRAREEAAAAEAACEPAIAAAHRLLAIEYAAAHAESLQRADALARQPVTA